MIKVFCGLNDLVVPKVTASIMRSTELDFKPEFEIYIRKLFVRSMKTILQDIGTQLNHLLSYAVDLSAFFQNIQLPAPILTCNGASDVYGSSPRDVRNSNPRHFRDCPQHVFPLALCHELYERIQRATIGGLQRVDVLVSIFPANAEWEKPGFL